MLQPVEPGHIAHRVLIADDHDLVRELIKLYLERQTPAANIVTARDAHEAFILAGKGSFDLIVLDLNMPGMEDLAGLHALRAAYPETPIALLSGDASRDQVFQAMAAGATGFLAKSVRARALIDMLNLLAAGERIVSWQVISEEPAPKVESRGDRLPDTLTEREKDIVRLLVEGHPNKVIASRSGIQEVTVKLHLRSIYRKLGAKNRVQAVRAVERLLPADAA